MKRLFGILLLCLLLSWMLSVGVAAESEEETLPLAVRDGYETMLDALPDELRDALPEGLRSDRTDEIAGAVSELLDVSFFLRALLEAVGFYAGDILRFLATVVGILLLSSVFVSFSRAVHPKGTPRMTVIVTSGAILVSVAKIQVRLFAQLEEYFGSLSSLAAGMIPVSGALYAMGGNLSGAQTGGTVMSVFLAVSEFVGGRALFPTVGACIALAAVPIFAPDLNVRSLSACIKRCFTFGLGFLMMLLSALLVMRSGLSQKADSVSARTVKYIASSVIPVVGGSIADSLRTVGASVEYLRTTVGIAGILLIALLLLPVLVNVLLTRFALILASSVAELLSCNAESRLLSELHGVYGYILAVSVMCAVMFILALTLLVKTAAAV